MISLAAAVLALTVRGVAAPAPAAPLPSPETILEQVIERAQLEESEQQRFKECYRYTRTRVTEYRNGDGDLKKRKARTRVNDPAVVPVVHQSEPARREAERAPRTSSNQPVSDTHTNVRGKAFEKSDFPINEDLLKRFDFTLTGREMIKGRPALVVDFKPVLPKAPERSIKDRFINKAAGRVWVDEEDYAVVQADLHLSEKVSVVGGLVGAVSKFTLFIERERTSEGLWFIRKQNWHLEGREVFIRRKVDYHEEYKDVQQVIEPQNLQLSQWSSIDGEALDE